MDWRFILQLKLKINTDRFDVGVKKKKEEQGFLWGKGLCLSNVYRRVPLSDLEKTERTDSQQAAGWLTNTFHFWTRQMADVIYSKKHFQLKYYQERKTIKMTENTFSGHTSPYRFEVLFY